MQKVLSCFCTFINLTGQTVYLMKEILRKIIATRNINAAYEEQIYKESLKSEIYRIYILIGIICFFILYLGALYIFYFQAYELFFQENNILLFGIIFSGILLFREIAVKNFLIKRINAGKNIPAYWKYINSLIEVSFPTLILIGFAQFTSPVYALFTPVNLLYFIFIILSTLELDEKLCLFVSAVAAVEWLFISLFYLQRTNIPREVELLRMPIIYAGKSVIILLGGLLASFVTYQIKKRVIGTFQIQDERNKFERLFSQQVSPAVVNELMNLRKNKIGVKSEVCIMFLDIRNYTKFAYNKPPEEIIQYQNTLFSFMIDIVTKHNGIVNQIMGDGFMASFGAPIKYQNDCLDAVNSAFEILAALDEKNTKEEIPFTRVGIGIHTGEAVTGNVGNSTRKQFSISGSVVIIASRIEQLNKEFNSSLLISKQVFERVKESLSGYSNLGGVTVKGSPEPIEIIKLK